MFLSKVDPETSDIFFNYGATSYLHHETFELMDLTQDAEKLLDILYDRTYTAQDLVDDFLNRL